MPATGGMISSNALVNFVETDQISGGFTSTLTFPVFPKLDPPPIDFGAIVSNVGATLSADIAVGVEGRFATLGGFSKYDLLYPAKTNTTEPRRVSRRHCRLSHAAMAGWSAMA